jgi:predicted 3-demethylubiquinone-9 3-methyltransferase (glyoxalase superfamily)
MGKITPWLWFVTEAEEAANYYTSIFKNSRITAVNRFGEGAPLPAGTVMTVSFELDGQQFVALNGGTPFHYTEAVSFYVDCADQAEVDYLWERLLDGGEPSQCGWLKDRYGVSWQIVPKRLGELLDDPDREKAARVMRAMLGMVKIDVAGLEAAAAG